MVEIPLDQAIPRFKQNENRVDLFTNGGENTSYQTSGGVPVPSLRKFLKDKESEIDEAADGILALSREARDAAQAWADNPEGVPVEGAAFSAKHHALKAALDALNSKKWASNAVDVPVEGGEFSAKHWATKAEGWANRNNWIVDGPFLGIGAAKNYALSRDPGTPNNMFVIAGGVDQLITQGAYELIYIAGQPFIRIDVPTGVPFEVRMGGSVVIGAPSFGSVGILETAPNLWLDLAPSGTQIGFASARNPNFLYLNTTFTSVDGLPTIASGDEVVSITRAPVRGSSKLLLEWKGELGNNNAPGNLASWGLFDGPNCVKAEPVSFSAAGIFPCSGSVVIPAVNTESRKFSLRIGPNNGGGSTGINIGGLGSTALGYGGKSAVEFYITEIKG